MDGDEVNYGGYGYLLTCPIREQLRQSFVSGEGSKIRKKLPAPKGKKPWVDRNYKSNNKTGKQ